MNAGLDQKIYKDILPRSYKLDELVDSKKDTEEAEGLLAGLDNPQQVKKQEAVKNPENQQKMA